MCFHPSYFKTDLPNFHFNPGKKKKSFAKSLTVRGTVGALPFYFDRRILEKERKGCFLAFHERCWEDSLCERGQQAWAGFCLEVPL